MKALVTALLLFNSLSVSAQKLTLNVALSPAGSFQATTQKIKGQAIKSKDGSFKADKISILVESLKTGIDLRDQHFWKHLKSSDHPKAVLTKVAGKDGKATGQLEVAGVTKPVTISYVESGSTINAKFTVDAKEFNLPNAQYLGVGVENKVTGEVSLPFKAK